MYIDIIFLEIFRTPLSPKSNWLPKLQTTKEDRKKFVLQNCVLSYLSTRFQIPASSNVSAIVTLEGTQNLETPEIYLINQEHAKSTSNKKFQSLEHDLYRWCAGVDRTTTNGKIEASNGSLANGVFTAELNLIGFPSIACDFVVNLKCGIADFYSVNKITKSLNKKCRLPKADLINAVFCNVLYFPCYVDVKTIKMKLVKEDFIEFSGNICNDLSCPVLV